MVTHFPGSKNCIGRRHGWKGMYHLIIIIWESLGLQQRGLDKKEKKTLVLSLHNGLVGLRERKGLSLCLTHNE
jgi:hypothetical protein